MAFVNEYATEEDFRKFDLNGIWDKFNPHMRGDYYVWGKPGLTIDREINIFLMVVGYGREEFSNEQYCLLWWAGSQITFTLRLANESSSYFTEQPYRQVFEMEALFVPKVLDISREIVIKTIKEALTVYGYRGIQQKIPNTVVEYKF
jgi:hypothetical protein